MSNASDIAFRLNTLLFILAILLVSAGGSLGLVYMKVETDRTAKKTRELEVRVAEMERMDRGLESRLAQALQPRELLRLADLRRLPLRPTLPTQVVHVRDWNFRDPGATLVAGEWGETPEAVTLAAAESPPGNKARLDWAVLRAPGVRD